MPGKVTEHKLGDAALVELIAEQEARCNFPAFNPQIAHKLGDFMRSRWPRVAPNPTSELYIQIRTASYRPGCPLVLYSTVALASDACPRTGNMAAGIAFQVEGKANTVISNGASSLSAKAFASMMGWEVTKMGLDWPTYNTNGGGFPIKLSNCTVPVGIILVSGMPDFQDHQFIVDALDMFLPTLREDSTPIGPGQ